MNSSVIEHYAEIPLRRRRIEMMENIDEIKIPAAQLYEMRQYLYVIS
jgi:hypothetical protein